MAVTEGGRAARTHYRVVERFRAHTYCELELETGRTHQIRVHMAHIRAPLARRPRLRRPAEAAARAPSDELRAALQGVSPPSAAREPACGSRTRSRARALAFESPLAPDLAALLDAAARRCGRSARDERRCRASRRTGPRRRTSAPGSRSAARPARYGTLNLATARRRRARTPSPRIAAACARRSSFPTEPRWLEQVHGVRVLDLDRERRRCRGRRRHGPPGVPCAPY